jgi:hypothetical protein
MLSMSLVELHPSEDPARQIVSQQALYPELKTLFTRLQYRVTGSIRLIQAGLLLTVYEYACGKPDDAYISIGTCARLASVIER